MKNNASKYLRVSMLLFALATLAIAMYVALVGLPQLSAVESTAPSFSHEKIEIDLVNQAPSNSAPQLEVAQIIISDAPSAPIVNAASDKQIRQAAAAWENKVEWPQINPSKNEVELWQIESANNSVEKSFRWSGGSFPVVIGNVPLPPTVALPSAPTAPTQGGGGAAPAAPAAPVAEPTPQAEVNAIAWWQLSPDSMVAQGSTWRVELIVRVPTSSNYRFELVNLASMTRTDTNLDGDDYYLLTMAGMECGKPLAGELEAWQNGLTMLVQNEYSLVIGKVYLNPPC